MGYVFSKSGGSFLITESGNTVYSSNSPLMFKINNSKIEVYSKIASSNGNAIPICKAALTDIDSIGGNTVAVTLDGAIAQLNDLVLDSVGGVSSLNSTATLLNAAATFTGTWEDISQYPSVVISVATDQNGTYTIQFSTDGSNADSTLTRYYRTNQINVPHRFTSTRKYMRVTFTNTSASNQTYLRLQVMKGSQTDLNIPIDSVMSQDFDATAVRPTDYHYEVALGRRQGNTTWNIWGYNADLDIGTETIWANGGVFSPMTAAATLSVVSASANDTSAGTGARTLLISGVDSNFDTQTETITLNGTTPVITSNTWRGINSAVVATAGSGQVNAGDITLTATGGGSTIQGRLPSGDGSTQKAFYFVAAHNKFLADYLQLSAEKTGGGATPKVRFKAYIVNPDTNTKTVILNELLDTSASNNLVFNPSQPFVIPEKCLLTFEATSDTADTFVACRFSGILVRDVDA